MTSREEAFEECSMVSDQKSYFELWLQRQTSAPCELNFLSFDDLIAATMKLTLSPTSQNRFPSVTASVRVVR